MVLAAELGDSKQSCSFLQISAQKSDDGRQLREAEVLGQEARRDQREHLGNIKEHAGAPALGVEATDDEREGGHGTTATPLLSAR